MQTDNDLPKDVKDDYYQFDPNNLEAGHIFFVPKNGKMRTMKVKEVAHTDLLQLVCVHELSGDGGEVIITNATKVYLKVKCEYCGEELEEGEEQNNPHRDCGGEAMCDDCYEEHYTFTCRKCFNTEDLDYELSVGSLFVLPEDENGFGVTVTAGIYRVKERPVYMASMLGAVNFYDDHIEKIANGTFDTEYGSLCRDCEKEFWEAYNRGEIEKCAPAEAQEEG